MTLVRRRRFVAVPMAVAIGLLTACASDADSDSDAAAGASASGCPITVADSWVKAAESGMTAAFGTLTNTGSADVTIVSAASDSAGRMEIHEVVDKDGAMVMQPKEGGLSIPAGESATLAPGQDHLMLMEIPAPIEPGDTVEITLTCADGDTAEYSGVAKEFEGAAEPYEPGEDMDMDMEMESSMSPSEG
jgi:copper(I)-binding protein